MAEAEETVLLNEVSNESIQNDRQSEAETKRSKSAIRMMLVATFLYMFPVAITFAVRPSLMLTAANNDTKKAAIFSSLVDASNALIAGLTSPLLGTLSDAKGRVPILQMCAAIEAVGLFGITLFRNSLSGQFIFYQLLGFASSSTAMLQAAIADVSLDPEQSHGAFARLNQVTAIAFFIGPVLGGYIASVCSNVVPMLIAAISLGVAAPFFGAFLIETRVVSDQSESGEKTIPRISLRESFRTMSGLMTSNTALKLLIASYLVESLGENGAFGILFMYTNERLQWNADKVGLFISALGLQLFLTQEVSARTVKVFGERNVLIYGYLSLAVHYLFYALASSAWFMWSGLLVGIPGFISYPISTAVISRQVSMEMQGQLQGSLFSITNLVQPLSSMGCALIFYVGTSYGMPGLVFIFIAGCSLTATFLANAGMKHPHLL